MSAFRTFYSIGCASEAAASEAMAASLASAADRALVESYGPRQIVEMLSPGDPIADPPVASETRCDGLWYYDLFAPDESLAGDWQATDPVTPDHVWWA